MPVKLQPHNKPLIEHRGVCPDVMADHLFLLAYEVEQAMLEAGANPGVDYDYKFLFEQAIRLSVGHAGKPNLNSSGPLPKTESDTDECSRCGEQLDDDNRSFDNSRLCGYCHHMTSKDD